MKTTSKTEAESDVQSAIRLQLSLIPGVRIFRNNVAKIKSPSGRWVEYGLGVGSSDLIGFRSVEITQEMVGSRIAQFLAVEVKRKGGVVSPEQQRFLDMVKQFHGISLVCDDALQIKRLLASQPSP